MKKVFLIALFLALPSEAGELNSFSGSAISITQFKTLGLMGQPVFNTVPTITTFQGISPCK